MKPFIHNVVTFIARLARRTPVTLALTVLILIVAVATGALWQSAEASGLVTAYGYGLSSLREGNWLSLFTGLLIAPTPWMYFTIVPLLLAGAGYIEYRYGAWKMLITVFVSHVASVLLVLGVVAIGQSLNAGWAGPLAAVKDVGFSNGAFGALGVATAILSMYWRFRVHVFTVLYCVIMVLYSGVIWDYTHLAALAIGIIIGPLVIGRPYERVSLKYRGINSRALVAAVVVFSAMSHFVIRFRPDTSGLLRYDAGSVANESIFFTITLLFLILWFAYGLYRGRRIAWIIVLTSALLSIVVNGLTLTQSQSPALIFDLIMNIAMAVTLIVCRKQFRATPSKATLKRVALQVAIAAVFVFSLHTAILYAIRDSFSPVPNFGDVAAESLYRTVGGTTGEFVPNNHFARMALTSIDDLWLLFFVASLVALLVSTRRDAAGQGKEVYLSLLKEWGGSTLSWMGTWKKIRYFTNDSKTAVLAYYVSNNVAIVLADPIGERRAVVELTEAFDRLCRLRGWTVAYFSSSAATMRLLKKQGYYAVQVAQDSLITLENLEFTGKPWQSVRSSLNKATKLGVTMRVVRLQGLPLAVRDQLNAIEQSWVQDKALPEMGFTLGTLEQAEDPEVRVHIAIDQDGTVHGMTSWLPVYEKGGTVNGWTLDIMQRRLDTQTMPGVMEFLIAESAQAFRQEGYKMVSLSGAPLSGMEHSTSLVERVMHWASVKFEPYYGFASLHRFKEKFQPTYEPMYLCYRDPDQLPLIGVAIGRAYMGDVTLLQAGIATLKEARK